MTLAVPKTFNSSSGNLVPQNSRQARALSYSAKWLAAEDDEMDLVIEKKVIGRTASCFPPSVTVISNMLMYALKRTLTNTIEVYKVMSMVLEFLRTPDIHYNPLAMRMPVASGSALMVLLSLATRYNLHTKQLDVKTNFLNSPLEHEV